MVTLPSTRLVFCLQKHSHLPAYLCQIRLMDSYFIQWVTK